MAVLLALITASAFGVGDFMGGVASRRASVAQVALYSHALGLVGVLAVAPLLSDGFAARDFGIGASGAVFGLAGLMLLYRGLAIGPMSVVAPITGVMSAVVPVVWGLLRGDDLALPVTIGIGLGLAAVALIGYSRDITGTPVTRATIIGAVGSGLGFGMFFIFISEADDGSAPWPIVGARLVTTSLLLIYATGRRIGPPPRPTWWWIVGAGICDVGANVAFQLATERGLLSVVAVVSAMYPAGTILLARFVLDERLQRHQLIGLGIAAAALVLVSVG